MRNNIEVEILELMKSVEVRKSNYETRSYLPFQRFQGNMIQNWDRSWGGKNE